MSEDLLFEVHMQWGAQPVHLQANRAHELPDDAPVTSVHIVALLGGRVLVVCDRRGVFGYPGGRLEPDESRDAAMVREVYEEAAAYLNPEYDLFATMRIECTSKLPGRTYNHPFTYMGLYAGTVRSLDPIRRDPAGIVTSRSLFTLDECRKNLQQHDRILLREALRKLCSQPYGKRAVSRFLCCDPVEVQTVLKAMREDIA